MMTPEEMQGMPPEMQSMAAEGAPTAAGPAPVPQGEPPMQPPPNQGEVPPKKGGTQQGGPATEEVMRGIQAVSKALYQDQAMSDKIIASVSEQEKVGSTAKAAIMLVTQMDKQLDLAERAIAAVTVFTADRLMELVEADARNKIEYSELEAKQVIMTTMEGILKAYGVTPERSAQVAQQIGPEETKKAQGIYEEGLKNG